LEVLFCFYWVFIFLKNKSIFSLLILKMALTNVQLSLIVGVAVVIVVTVVLLMTKNSSPSTATTTVASDNKTYFPMMSEGEGKKAIKIASPQFNYNPSTNVLSAGTFKGDLDGSAKNIKIFSSDMQGLPSTQRMTNNAYQSINDMRMSPVPMRAQGMVGATIPSVTEANKRFLTMTSSSSTGPQQLAVSPNVWYDTQNNLLNVDAAGAYNIKGGEANQLLFQKGPNDTGYIVKPTSSEIPVNQYLKWTGQTYEFSTFPSAGNLAAAGNNRELQFNNAGNFGTSPNLLFGDNNILTIGGTGAGLTVGSGTITAGSFRGNLTGNVTGNITGQTGSFTGQLTAAGLTVGSGNITAGSFRGNLTGNVTGQTGSFTGNVSATEFVGPLTGNVTGQTGSFTGQLTAAGLTVGSGNITAGSFRGNLTGNVTGQTGTFTGNVTAIGFSGPLTGDVNGNASSANKVMITSL
jgi:hypothetical protein